MSNEYGKLLKDPRWQKKRLEILSRDEWSCKQCGDKKESLQVHHLHYVYGKMPWDYDGDMLITLCEPCHEMHTAFTRYSKQLFGQLSAQMKGRALGYMAGLLGYSAPTTEFSNEYCLAGWKDAARPAKQRKKK